MAELPIELLQQIEEAVERGLARALSGLEDRIADRLLDRLRPPSNEDPVKTLSRLLIDLFESKDLRRVIPQAIQDTLPENLSLVDLSHEVAKAFYKHGTLDAAFFDDLVEERPGRVADIRAVQMRCLGEVSARRER